MELDYEKTINALQTAIQMEVDGKEYYVSAAKASPNEIGKRLFSSLAAEEDIHMRKFEEIYEVIRTNQNWPVTDFQPDGGKKIRTIFALADRADFKPEEREFTAIQKAIDMENKSFDFYQQRIKESSSSNEQELFTLIAAEEREHKLILLDYYEYVKNPADWFTMHEHQSLDGV